MSTQTIIYFYRYTSKPEQMPRNSESFEMEMRINDGALTVSTTKSKITARQYRCLTICSDLVEKPMPGGVFIEVKTDDF